MSKSFVLIDSYNLFFRAMYGVKSYDIDTSKAMLLHTLIYMIKKACDKFNPDHLVICADGKGTWRKNIYPQYKANRIERYQDKTPSELEKEKELLNIFENDFLPFLKDKTNVTFLNYTLIEADDLIARFIALHPNDIKIIVSTDNDFIQLIDDNVVIFNTMEDRIISKDCIINSNDFQPIKFFVKDGKVSVKKNDFKIEKGESLTPMKDWVEYALFLKCIRGDSSDNIPSAYPGIREKSTKKTVGILDAFADRENKGYNWQTFMNSTWEDIFGNKKIVKECYEFNKKIIDLKEIPEDMKNEIDEYIKSAFHKEYKQNIGIDFIRYLSKWNLKRLEDQYSSYSKYFYKTYPYE